MSTHFRSADLVEPRGIFAGGNNAPTVLHTPLGDVPQHPQQYQHQHPSNVLPALPPRPMAYQQNGGGGFFNSTNSMYGNGLGGGLYGGSGLGGYGSAYGMGGGYGSGYGMAGGYSPYGMGGGGYGVGSYGGGMLTNRYGAAGANGLMDAEARFIQLAEESSRPAFQSIESLVGAIGNIAAMLDSTFFAITSSFRAILGVAANFGRLRGVFAQFWSTFALFRGLSWLFKK